MVIEFAFGYGRFLDLGLVLGLRSLGFVLVLGFGLGFGRPSSSRKAQDQSPKTKARFIP